MFPAENALPEMTLADGLRRPGREPVTPKNDQSESFSPPGFQTIPRPAAFEQSIRGQSDLL
jgi:hypothetical protein